MKRDIEDIIKDLDSPAIITDPDISKVISVNPSGVKLMGKNKKDVMKFLDFQGKAKQEVAEQVQLYGFHTQKVKGYQVEYNKVNTKKDKGSVLIRINKNGNTDDRVINEKVRAVLAEEINRVLKHEINQHKITQEKLYEAQQFSRSIIESSLDMIIAVDKDDKIREINKAGLRLFGYEADEILGKPSKTLFAFDIEYEIVKNAIIKHGNYSGEIQNIDKQGNTFSSLLSASRLINNNGEIVGSMGVSRDVTESKKQEQKIQEQSAKINAIFDSSSHIIWSVDKNFNVTSYNKNFEKFLKRQFKHKMTEKTNIATDIKGLKGLMEHRLKGEYKKAFKEKKQVFEMVLPEVKGESEWIEIYLSPIYSENGRVVEVSGIGHYITDKKESERQIMESLKEKEVLLQEVHHRVKNNLQVISSILNLQSSYVKDKNSLNILRESQNRIKSMSFIHESLYQTKDFNRVDFEDYITGLTKNLLYSYSMLSDHIALDAQVDRLYLSLDQAIPCGLIVNELVSNALKYAFPDDRKGVISVRIFEKKNVIHMEIGDDGVGFPKGFDIKKSDSLGLQLVYTLTEQLDGDIKVSSKKGTKYLIKFEKLKS
ncbi:MAG: PAS domain S-box protein [Flavobacteriales bacterium]|nr:PAS domain S-box protein [Flavobacteriales bacterium]